MSQHARLKPSSAARWVICPGSVVMEEAYPDDETSPKAAEGHAAHWVALDEMLVAGREPKLNDLAPNDIPVTLEMLEGADLLLSNIRASIPVGVVLHVEERARMEDIHADNWGTPDVWACDSQAGRLYLWDYKFGHRYVEVFRNWQLIDYAKGVFNTLGGLANDIREVIFRIVQPRSYHADGQVREWVVPVSHLWPLWEDLRQAAAVATQPNPLCRPNDECRDCSGRHACAALQAVTYDGAERAYDTLPVTMSAGAKSLELTTLSVAADRLKARIEGLEEDIAAMIRRGESVPGYTLQSSVGRETWSRPVEEIIALGETLGLSLAKPGVLTPAQARKVGVAPELVGAYSTRPAGGAKLVRVDTTDAQKVFGRS